MSIVERVGSLLGGPRQEREQDPYAEGATPVDAQDEYLEGVFELLTNRRRRHVVEEVAALGAGEWIGINDLAVTIAAYENGVSPDDLETSQRKRVYVALYQTHLDKLSNGGVVATSETGNKVRKTPGTEMAIDAWRAARREIPVDNGGIQ